MKYCQTSGCWNQISDYLNYCDLHNGTMTISSGQSLTTTQSQRFAVAREMSNWVRETGMEYEARVEVGENYVAYSLTCRPPRSN